MLISIVFSAGRSGTNLLLESMRGNPYFVASDPPEDKLLFIRDIRYPDRYLTKSDSVYCPSYQHFYNLMIKNPSVNILWCTRHPYDWCLSKLYRGRALPKRGNKPSDDGTPEGCIQDMMWMYSLYKRAKKDFSMRILEVKMEDIILNIEAETKRICKNLCILWDKEMMYPHKRMRHLGKKKRYGDKLDKSQISLYKNLDTIYNGYFLDKKEDVQKVFDAVHFMIGEFGYNA